AAERRHQHQIAARDADVGGERRPFAADAFLDDLHQDFVAAAKDVLNRRLDARPGSHAAAANARLRAGAGVALAVAFPLLVLILVAEVGLGPPGVMAVAFQRLVGVIAPLAEVLRLDVADVQEAVAADAEIDEGGLDARLQVDDHSLVDVADEVVLARALDVQL